MTIDAGKVRLEKRGDGGSYVFPFADGLRAELDFVEQGTGIVVITHTGTPPRHRGQGAAALLVETAVTDFRAAGKTVIPACSYARGQFDAHPEWADLLQPG